jgi:hypothetical protein
MNSYSSAISNVAIICQSATQFKELKKMAIRMNSSTRYRLLFVADGQIAQSLTEQISKFCQEYQIPFLDLSHRKARHEYTGCGIVSRLRARARDLVWSYRKPRLLMSYWEMDCLIVGEDGLGGPIELIAFARKKGVPTVIVPYEYSSRKQIIESLRSLTADSNVQTLLARLVARFFPKWVTLYEGKRWLRLNPLEVIYMELKGALVENPWTVHGGSADLLLAESEQMKLHYLGEGVREEKILLTGSLVGDEIFEQEKKLTPNFLSANSDENRTTPRPLKILCAFPPSYVDERVGICKYQSFSHLIGDWILALESLPNAVVTYQGHPNLSAKDRQIIEEYVHLSNKDVTELIYNCDLLVTSVSSIIRTAIQCSKPVVNYDVYEFDYPDYKDVSSVYYVNELEELREVLQRLTSTFDSYLAAVQDASINRNIWGVIDGKSWQRIDNAVSGLILKHNSFTRE